MFIIAQICAIIAYKNFSSENSYAKSNITMDFWKVVALLSHPAYPTAEGDPLYPVFRIRSDDFGGDGVVEEQSLLGEADMLIFLVEKAFFCKSI